MITLEELVAQQLRGIVADSAAKIAAIGDRDGADAARARGVGYAAKLAVRLCADNDDAAALVEELGPVLWPDPPLWWWTTALGKVVARHTSTAPEQALTFAAAATMLGISRTTVHDYAKSATADLVEHPDHGVTRASVLARIARLSRTQH